MSPHRSRYSRWDGTQQINPISPDEILRALADDLLDEGNLDLAMQRLFRFGFDGENGERFPGLREMMERLRQRRQQQLQRYDMGSVLGEIEEKLKEILETERSTIEERLNASRERLARNQEAQARGETPDDPIDEDLQQMLEQISDRKRGQLDALPQDPAGQIRGLQDYEFMNQQAAEEFRALLEQLQQQVLQQTFQGMQESLSNMSPEALAEMAQMMGELNEMLERHQRGEDPGFNEFMHRWGHYFDPGIQTIEELIEHMRQR
ncbi:MAG: VWA domain-containing protein, partial [Thermomicrobiales bacterium]